MVKLTALGLVMAALSLFAVQNAAGQTATPTTTPTPTESMTTPTPTGVTVPSGAPSTGFGGGK